MPNILHNSLRVLKFKDPDTQNLAAKTHDELKRLEAAIPQNQTSVSAPIVVGGSTSSGSSGSSVSSSNDRASFVAITSIVDQFIPFSSAIPVGYELFVNMQDTGGTYGQVNVPRPDWLANGFWLRKGNIIISSPATTGILWYIAKANT